MELVLGGRPVGPEVAQHGITWWWCDALFMGPPVLVKAGLISKQTQYLTFSDTLYQQTYKRLFNHQKHLFSRDASYLWDAAGQGRFSPILYEGCSVGWPM